MYSTPYQPIILTGQPIPQQTLLAQQTEYQQSMSTETKPCVGLSIFLLKPITVPEKAYNLGLKIAEEKDVVFQGLLFWSIANPNRDVHYYSFLADVDKINEIIEKIRIGLNMDDLSLQWSIAPSVRPKDKPPPSMAT